MFGLDSKESSFPWKFNLCDPMFRNADQVKKMLKQPPNQT